MGADDVALYQAAARQATQALKTFGPECAGGRPLERAGLDEQNERRAADPAEEGQLHGPSLTERPGQDEIQEQSDDRRCDRLGEPQTDLGEKVAHR